MHELIETIRAAVADGATAEQKATGAQACRTILAALEAAPGKPIVLPDAPRPHPLSGISLDQALDLAIARLRTIAEQRDGAGKVPQRVPNERSGPRIALIPTPPRVSVGGRPPTRRKP